LEEEQVRQVLQVTLAREEMVFVFCDLVQALLSRNHLVIFDFFL
jgi:hypothetical protein